MFVWDVFRQFIFSKRANALVRRIAWLSIISISISVTAFLLVIFVMNGMNESIIHRIIGLEPHILIYVNDDSNTSKTLMGSIQNWLAEKSQNSGFRTDPKIEYFPFETQEVILRTSEGQFRGAIARGLSRESLNHFNQQMKALENVKGGGTSRGSQAFQWDVSELPAKEEIAIGYDLARLLNVYEGNEIAVLSPEGLLLPPGQMPRFEKVKIKKVIMTSLSDIDSQYIFYQKGEALDSLKKSISRKTGFEIYTDHGNSVAQLKSQMNKEFSATQIETWEERNSAMFFSLKMEKFFIGLFLGLAGLIASSSVLSVLVLLLSEKQTDIAILRTLGLSSKGTLRLFTQVGALVSSFGVVIGVVLGTGLGLILQYHPLDVLPEIYYDSQIPAKVEWVLVVGVLVVGGAIAWLGSYVPAKSATQLNPTDILRMKN